MSVIIKDSNGAIYILTKGADSMMIPIITEESINQTSVD